MTLLFYLFAGHFLCDFPLQGDFLANGKNHTKPIPGIPWQWCLLAHCFIQAGMVAVITQNIYFGLAELCIHMFIDWCKCSGFFGFTVDQFLHLFCKLLWFLLLKGILR